MNFKATKNILLVFCLISYTISSQVGIGTTTPHSAAALEIHSNSKGLLLPRLTSVQMYSIDSNVKGLMVYCTDCSPEGLYVNNGHSFKEISKSNTTYNDDYAVTGSVFNSIFPFRADISDVTSTATRTDDFYSYDAFREAVDYMSDIILEIHRYIEADPGDGSFPQDPNTNNYYQNYLYKTVRKKDGEPDVFTLSSNDWNEPWNTSKEIFIERTIKFSEFLNNATEAENEKELAAFFAQISHETSGGVSDGIYDKGLFYKEEVYCTTGAGVNDPNCDYIDNNNGNDVNYPAATGKRYYGRGPIQLSWNYNYGDFSFIYYGYRNVLLNNPDIITQDASVAFASAIAFWMTPRGSIPSAHDVINTNGARGFAHTINIINGGLECGASNNTTLQQQKVTRRINYFKAIGGSLGITINETDSELRCIDLTPY